jgi:hypothetical protein
MLLVSLPIILEAMGDGWTTKLRQVLGWAQSATPHRGGDDGYKQRKKDLDRYVGTPSAECYIKGVFF